MRAEGLDWYRDLSECRRDTPTEARRDRELASDLDWELARVKEMAEVKCRRL